jgi:hypothetical protein
MRRVVLALSMFLVAVSPACRERDRGGPDGAAVQQAPAAPGSSPAASDTTATPPPAPTPPRIERDAGPVLAVKDWTWKTYRGDRFSVLFPGEPKVTALPAEDDKVGYTEAKLDVPGNKVSFAAGFSDHAAAEVAKPESFLDDHVNAPRWGVTDVLHERSLTLGGNPGRVLILRRNISGTPLRIYSRLYLVKQRLYSLIVSTLDVGGVDEDVVKRFMDSFKLL